MPVLKKIWQAFNGLNEGVYVLGALIIFLLGALTIRDVGGRYLFNRPLMGNLELSELAMVSIIFLCFGCSITLRAHIHVDILTHRLPRRAKIVLEIGTDLLTLLFMIVVATQSASLAVAQRGNYTDTLQIPTFLFTLLVPFGSTLAAIALLGHIAANIRSLWSDKGVAP